MFDKNSLAAFSYLFLFIKVKVSSVCRKWPFFLILLLHLLLLHSSMDSQTQRLVARIILSPAKLLSKVRYFSSLSVWFYHSRPNFCINSGLESVLPLDVPMLFNFFNSIYELCWAFSKEMILWTFAEWVLDKVELKATELKKFWTWVANELWA